MYKLVKQKRKTISIGIDDDFKVIVKAPHHMPKKCIDDFVKKHQNWIENTRQSKQKAKVHEDWWQSHKLLYLGEYKKIEIIQSIKEKVSLDENSIKIYLKDSENQERAKIILEKWLTEEMRHAVTEISDNYCKLLGYNYNKIYIRKQRTRWGSCSSKGNLSYNSRLICAPKACIRYIGLHEVMHLKHFNHGTDFWKEIKQMMPEYKVYQRILKDHGDYFNF